MRLLTGCGARMTAAHADKAISLLCAAAAENNVGQLEAMLVEGASAGPSCADYDGRTPLHVVPARSRRDIWV